jgi:histone acetyltransferase 1
LINFDRQCKDISIPLKFTGEFMKAVQRKLKINKNQIRKIYDIIKLKETNRSDKECYKNYRLMVKRKIYYNYKSHLETLNKEEKLFLLDQLYKELESYYQSLLERFSRA